MSLKGKFKSIFSKFGWTERLAITALILTLIFLVIIFFAGGFEQDGGTDTALRSPIDQKITFLEKQLVDNSKDLKLYFAAASVYLQKVRETADTALYANVDDLMVKAENLDANSSEVFAFKAQVAMGRHNFSQGLKLGQRSLELSPGNARYHGIVADAQIELGMYDEAVESLQKMVDIKPDFASYSRIAYARELHGDIEGAIESMQQATEAGATYPENVAWAHVELGKLYFALNNLAEAESNFNAALEKLPDYSPAWRAKGRIALAKGDSQQAFSYFQRAVDKLPIDANLIDLADMYFRLGNVEKAKQLYEVVKIVYKQAEKNGVDVNLELALFLADHDLDLDQAVIKARAGYEKRPSINSADALAWSLYKNGSYEEAKKYSIKSLELGTRDANRLFHAGMIFGAAGEKAKAKEYLQQVADLNPNFSIIYEELAAKTLTEL